VELCIWNAAAGVKKACTEFYGGETKMVCRKYGRYKISYEMVAYSTYGGYNPCFENDGPDCPEIIGMYIKICDVAKTPPKCSERTERKWRYFSFGNQDDTIFGLTYTPGTYEVSYQTMTDDGCMGDYLTSTVILRSSCQGDEDFVLT
jgi:hypothetical protein